jgi:S1-C subfamily serine protease
MRLLPLVMSVTTLAVGLAAQGGSSIRYGFLELQDTLYNAMDKVAPSTVTVQTFGGTRKVEGGKRPLTPPKMPKGTPPGGKKKKPPPLGMKGFLQSQGATTGIILSEDGWIIVSKFALNYDPTTILITLHDGRTFNAVRKGEDISRQIALVKIEAEGLPVPKFADPNKVKVGQWAFVLGRTFGAKDPSVHMGVVSATRRVFGRALQTDAYTSPANYGGPLIDIEGRVLGISVPMDASGRKANVGLYDSGIGFAASIADIQPLIERMKKGEVLHRGFLGIGFDMSHLGPGAKLKTVIEKSAAYKAGIRKSYTVLSIDGTKVLNNFHLQMLVGIKMAGDPVHLKVRKRNKEEFGVTVFLTKVPDAQMAAKKKAEAAADEPLPWEKDRK